MRRRDEHQPIDLLDDPRLTAYALGELDDDEAREVRELIAGHDEANAYIRSIRATANTVRNALSSEPAASDDDVAKLTRARAERTLHVEAPKRRLFLNRYSLAATLLIATGIGIGAYKMMERSSEPYTPQPTAPIATLIDASGTLMVNDDIANPGSDYAAGDYAIESGSAQFMLRDGKTVQMNGKARVRILGVDQIEVIEGDVTVTPPGGAPRRVLSNTDPTEHLNQTYAAGETAAQRFQKELDRPLIADAGGKTLGRPGPGTRGHADSALPTTPDAPTYALGRTTPGNRSNNGADIPGSFGGLQAPQPPVAIAPNPVDPATQTWPVPPGDAPQEPHGRTGEPRRHHPGQNTETYDRITDNPFKRVGDHPLSTFSIDVDTASYTNVRRMLRAGQMPPAGAVRIEEFINYFSYAYPNPVGPHPLASHVEVADCPWTPGHRLVRVGVQAKRMAAHQRPASNLVFLLDVSGSMNANNKLPLLKESMKMMVDELDERDRVAIVVYAGSSGLVLPSTHVTSKDVITGAIDRLHAGGSTAGAAGIQQAYQVATECFIKGGVNRVILATDGDFNVGVSSDDELVRLIEDKRKSGVFLSVLGFGMGNLKDSKMEKLSNAGNGNYAYIDTKNEAHKALVEQLAGTLVTVAKDVKIQVEFNPEVVAAYRLIGYENRLLAKEDFNDDTKDAGEVGAGHSVTALYEVVPTRVAATHNEAAIRGRIEAIDAELQGIRDLLQRARLTPDGLKLQTDRIAALETERAVLARRLARPTVDPLKYQPNAPREAPVNAPIDAEMLTVKLRYKAPDSDTSMKIEHPVRDTAAAWDKASADMRFASSVAAFGMVLRNSPYKGAATFGSVTDWAAAVTPLIPGEMTPEQARRAEFLQLVRTANQIAPGR